MKRLIVIIAAALCLLPAFGLRAQTAEAARGLHEKGLQYLREGNIHDGREYTRQALEMRRELFGEISEEYIITLNNYALSYFMSKDYPEALRLQRKVLELCEGLDSPHPDVCMFLMNIGRTCYFSGYYADAARYLEKALPLEEKFSPSYEHLLTLLGMTYSDMNDLDGMTRVMAMMEEHNRHELTKECDEPECMLERAQYYASVGENAKAREHFLKVLSMDIGNDMRIAAYKAYAQFLFSINDFVSSAEYESAAAGIMKSGSGLTEEYAAARYRAGNCYFIGGAYEQALEMYEDALSFYSAQDTPDAGKKAADCLKGMGNSYSGMKDYPGAMRCYAREISYYEAENPESTEYLKAVLRMAKAEKHSKQYDKSIETHKQAIRMFEERGMMQEYSDAVSSLQMCYQYSGNSDIVDYDEAKVEEDRLRKLEELIAGEKSNLNLIYKYLGDLSYAGSLATIAGCYDMMDAQDSALVYFDRYMETVRMALSNEFRLQGEDDRMITWQEQTGNMQHLYNMLISQLTEEDGTVREELCALVYDAELLSKGILLKSAVEFGNILESMGDKALLQAYEQSRANEARLETLRASVSTEADIDSIVALSQRNQALALYLYGKCAEFADFTDYILYDWKDVQEELRGCDLAVEFAVVETGMFEWRNLMVALVLTEDMSAPAAVPLCTVREAEEMVRDDSLFLRTDNPVWRTLAPYLEGRERIFFSPDGVFSQVAVEYLPYNGRPLSHQFEVYRLSSTKELCYDRPEIKLDKAVLIGDINYNDSGDYEAASVAAEQRGSGDAGGFANLSATREEINAIDRMLDSTGISDVSRYCDMKADKETFLNISDTDVNLLHIATHGMYTGTEESSDMGSMSCSVLALAGANISDDGLVSAEEISAMNLRQCSLVVLSACETGLGKLGDDGVFGLQRGFKNAGARTILMSLNDVYDAATARLMISFYRHLLGGSPAHKALALAQQDLIRSGYSAPEYWTPFILLDAI